MPELAARFGMPVRTSTLVPEGQVWVVHEDAERIVGQRVMRSPMTSSIVVNPRSRDRYGSHAAVVRMLTPRPGYTRHSLGVREIERDVRRARRGLA